MTMEVNSLLEAYRKLYFPKKTDDEFIYKNVLDRDGPVRGFVGKSWEKDAGTINTGKETGSGKNK